VDEIMDTMRSGRADCRSVTGQGKTAFEVSENIFGADLPDFDQFLGLMRRTFTGRLMITGIVTSKEKGGIVLYQAR